MPFENSTFVPYAELRRKFDEGAILEDDERIISFRVKTFQALVDRLLEATGLRAAECCLLR
jgi:hypothetical protein